MSNSNLVGLAEFGNVVEGVAGGVIEADEVEGWAMFFRFGCGPFEIVGVGGGVKVELEKKTKFCFNLTKYSEKQFQISILLFRARKNEVEEL